MDRSSVAPDDLSTNLSNSEIIDEVIDDASRPFVGTWHKLVSSTNWEKGRIIATWREAQMAAGVEASAYSDEAWAQMVGDVTSQHVGRLRRVFDRFGVSHPEYPGLYWSHFHAALDWEDAEIWLEGAVQKKWSIAQMRRQRDEVYQKPPANDEPEVVAGRLTRDPGEKSDGVVEGDLAVVQDLDGDSAPDGDSYDRDESHAVGASSETVATPPAQSSAAKARPFANLAELPDDMADAFENFKLAILHHKLTGWTAIPLGDVLAALEALKLLAQAPSE